MPVENRRWIYLSPHLDDAVLSCGGMIWEQIQMGYSVHVWTLFAGNPPEGEQTAFAESLHARWGTRPTEVVIQRRAEDVEACTALGAVYRHFSLPDCIYRRLPGSGQPVIRGEEDLFRLHYSEEGALSKALSKLLQDTLLDTDILVVPFGIGSHIDHQLVHLSVQGLQNQTWYYADYPYAAGPSVELRVWQDRKGESYLLPVSSEGLDHWQKAVSAYRSQISTFWRALDQMKAALRTYWVSGGGSMLRR